MELALFQLDRALLGGSNWCRLWDVTLGTITRRKGRLNEAAIAQGSEELLYDLEQVTVCPFQNHKGLESLK